MMRFGLLLLAGGLFLIWTGGRGIYEAAASGKQQTVTYANFVQRHPGIGWYKVTNAGWDLEDCMYVTSKKKYETEEDVETVFLPVHAANMPMDPNGRITMVLETERKDLREFIKTASKASEGSMPEPPANLLHYSGNIDGTVAFGGDLDSESRDLLKNKLGAQLDPNYVIIRDGKKPSGGTGFLCLVGGIVCTGLGAAVLGSRNR